MNSQTQTIALLKQDNDDQIPLGKAAKSCWKAWLREGNAPTATQMAIYAFLRGADINKAFTPISNANKLANGYRPWDGRNLAIKRATRFWHSDWAPFHSLLAGVESQDLRWPPTEKHYIPKGNALLEKILERAKLASEESPA